MVRHRTANGNAMLVMCFVMQEFKTTKKMENEKFTKREWVKYGILYPIGLIVMCMIADYIDRLVFS